MERDLLGFVVGLVLSTVTSPVGVSGAVFLLPIQLSVFGVPNPQVTPTNLLYNVLSGPGALLRYGRQGQLGGPLVSSLALGSAPGVIIGAVLRVYVADDPTVFKLVAAAVLAPTGLFILGSTRVAAPAWARAPLSPGKVTLAAFIVGVVGGIYGIGGGSILGPILVGSGMAVSVVAPAALASTFITSIVGSPPSRHCSSTRPGRSARTGRSAWRAGSAGCVAATWAPPCNPTYPRRRFACSSDSSPSDWQPCTSLRPLYESQSRRGQRSAATTNRFVSDRQLGEQCLNPCLRRSLRGGLTSHQSMQGLLLELHRPSDRLTKLIQRLLRSYCGRLCQLGPPPASNRKRVCAGQAHIASHYLGRLTYTRTLPHLCADPGTP